MQTNNTYDPQKLDEYIKLLPRGEKRMEALLEAINQADKEQDHFNRLFFRYDYALEATFHDDPPKAMPIAMQFSKIFEENPDALNPDFAGELYVMIMQFAVDPIPFLPQVSMTQWDEMLEQYLSLCKRFNVGMGSYYHQKSQRFVYTNPTMARELFEKSLECEIDALTDCEACQKSYAAKLSLALDNLDGAKEDISALESGELDHCHDTPQKYVIEYLDYYLSNGNLTQALNQADILYSKGFSDRNDLTYLGYVIQCYAYDSFGIGKASLLFEKHLQWSFNMWDKKKLFDFYKGSFVLFKELEKITQSVKFNLPKEFELYNKEGDYLATELKEWFYKASYNLALEFDNRNGSNWFKDKLAKAIG